LTIKKKDFVIKNIIGADEYKEGDNSAYMNSITKKVLKFSSYVTSILCLENNYKTQKRNSHVN